MCLPHVHVQSDTFFLIRRKPELLKNRMKFIMKKIFMIFVPGASLDNSRGDGGQLPLEMLPEVVV